MQQMYLLKVHSLVILSNVHPRIQQTNRDRIFSSLYISSLPQAPLQEIVIETFITVKCPSLSVSLCCSILSHNNPTTSAFLD